MNDASSRDWFTRLTSHKEPRNWQNELASGKVCRDRLIRIPTGLGKTEGVLAAWSYHRICRADEGWPRRLIWCLPMRVLVEQVEQVARQLTERIPEAGRPGIHLAMGGEDSGEWYLYPERPAIIIGTQDMLLSRSLNRGYASPRARWPMEFGQLSQDALWIMDEVQLMDVGLATSAQLQAFRQVDREKMLRPCHTWWMSATLQPDWLRSVDTEPYIASWIQEPCTVASNQRNGGLWEIRKSLELDTIDPRDDSKFAQRILHEHSNVSAGDFGRITLVVCNTVERACQTFDALRSEGRSDGLELVHSRFRPAEREQWRERFLSRSSCTHEVDRIIVATQVVEAGVDISAGCLITELAPWPSLVQRFGRCARYGGGGKVLVVNRDRGEASAAPYRPEELESSWETLRQLQDVGIATLETYEEFLSKEARERLYPYAPSHLLLQKELEELFDTTPDLTGADLDISRFIRSDDERDLQVFWVDLGKGALHPAKCQPHRRELCAVRFLDARDWLCGKESKSNRKPKLLRRMRAWVWDWIEGEWIVASRSALLPGRIVCVAAFCGGYRTDRGFDSGYTKSVTTVTAPPPSTETVSFDEADNRQDGEQLSFNPSWKTIACHATEVAGQVGEISRLLGIPKTLQEILELAAIWHDWGKSHPAFQGAMKSNGTDRPNRQDLAKAPKEAWRRPPDMYRYPDGGETRPAFRHELASALGLFAILEAYAPGHPALLGPWIDVLEKMGGSRPSPSTQPPSLPSPLIERVLQCSPEAFDLVAYLVASHHGKVRVGLHASPKDQDYRDRDERGLPIRGVREGDRLPSVELTLGESPVPEVMLTLSPAAIGLSPRTGASWRERCIGLINRYGPSALAYLEAILRAADVRASRLKTVDPALEAEVGA